MNSSRRFAAISNSRRSNLAAFRERSAPIWNFFLTRKSPRCFARTSRRSPSPRSTPEKSCASPCRRNSQSERLYINTILKLSYYFHALSRFDKPAEERDKSNLIVFSADEGQEILTAAESAFADHRAAGVIREARATMIIATQAYTSIHGVLDKRHADVLMLNLSNELIFTVANHDSAVIASKNIGEREVVEKSWGWAAGKRSYNYQKKIKPFFEPYQLAEAP